MYTEDFQRIEDYLLGNLAEAERLVFETEMRNNPVLAEAVAMQTLEHRAMQLALRDDLRTQMIAWKQELIDVENTMQEAKIIEMPKQPTAKVISLNRKIFRWAAAAAILLLAVFGGRLLFAPETSRLALAQNFYEEPALGTKGGSENTVLNECENLLINSKYQDAINCLIKINDNATIEKRLFLLGHAYFKANNFPMAATTFEQITTLQTDDFNKQRAEWYLLLSQVAANPKGTSFLPLLNKIRTGSSIYRVKAEELKHKLE